MNKQEIVSKIKDILYKHYSITCDGECGCYCNGKWLSVDDVINVIEENL